MEHDAVIEAIELAALEPGGLDRLTAGDTATSQAVAAHLAGCTSCAEALAATERESRIVADVVATTPPADLRAKTLAVVGLRGVLRGEGAAAPTDDAVAEPEPAFGAAVTIGSSRRRSTLPWVAAIAAAILLSVGVTTVVVSDRLDAERAAQADTIGDLQHVTWATMRVASEPDATTVALTGTQDPAMSGSIVFSPSTTELVVVAKGLIEPSGGMEYSCWMDAGAGRVRIGKMFFGGGLAYWVGDSQAIAGLSSPAAFGVSLIELASPVMDPDPVLIGRS